MPYKYPSLRTTLPVAGYYARLDAGAAASDQFTADGANDGTLTDGATRTNNDGLAYSLDGVNDYINISDASALSFTGAMTAVAWINVAALPPASNGNRMWVLTKGDIGQFEYEISINGFSGDFGKIVCVRYSRNGASAVIRPSSASIVASTWTHVAFTAASATAVPNVYINGSLNNGSSSTFGTVSPANGTAPLQIGRRATATENTFNGLIDDLLLWPVELSATDIGFLASQRGAIYQLIAGGSPINGQSLIRPAGSAQQQLLIQGATT